MNRIINAGVVMLQKDKVLLVREAEEPFRLGLLGKYDNPI